MSRIALFTHDAFGLGHMRRSVHLINGITRRAPGANCLLITGSPTVNLLHTLPKNCDYIKIPTIVTSGEDDNCPPVLGLGAAEIASFRGRLVREVLLEFGADAFVVDNFPLGTRFELLPALKMCRNMGIPTILGLRDILDPPKQVRRSWERDGIYNIVDRYFSKLIIYGDKDVFDVTKEYKLSDSLAQRLTYCGYVAATPPSEEKKIALRRRYCRFSKLIVVSVGGGGDGSPLLRAFLKAMPAIKDAGALVVTGEFMSENDRDEIANLAAADPSIILEHYIPDLAEHMAVADVTISMAGYNTTSEIMAMGARAIVVPRTWPAGEHAIKDPKRMDGEQLLRAKLLSKKGHIEFIHPDDLSPELVTRTVNKLLNSDETDRALPSALNGADRAAEEILATAQTRAQTDLQLVG